MTQKNIAKIILIPEIQPHKPFKFSNQLTIGFRTNSIRIWENIIRKNGIVKSICPILQQTFPHRLREEMIEQGPRSDRN